MGSGQDHRRRSRATARARLQPLSERRSVDVGPDRIARWLAGFAERHGPTQSSAAEGALHLLAADGSSARCRALLPFHSAVEEAGALLDAFVTQAQQSVPVALLLVRRGGFGIALVEGSELLRHKVGTRYVQSRTAAGGWSQQRFARRRDNQAAGLLDAAAQTAVRLLLGEDGRTAPDGIVVVTGGDKAMAERLLADHRLGCLAQAPHPRHLDVGDPRSDVLRQAARRSVAVQVDVTNA